MIEFEKMRTNLDALCLAETPNHRLPNDTYNFMRESLEILRAIFGKTMRQPSLAVGFESHVNLDSSFSGYRIQCKTSQAPGKSRRSIVLMVRFEELITLVFGGLSWLHL